MEPRGAEAERPWPPPHSKGSASRTALIHSPVPHLGLANEHASAASPWGTLPTPPIRSRSSRSNPGNLAYLKEDLSAEGEMAVAA